MELSDLSGCGSQSLPSPGADLEKGLHEGRIELLADLVRDDLARPPVRDRLLVRAFAAERVVDVGHGENPRRAWNRLARQALAVALTVARSVSRSLYPVSEMRTVSGLMR